ncbi:MAG TPA: hypothetical protein P5077_03170 [bacterium]|nr:hypothetical protein [bacterium]
MKKHLFNMSLGAVVIIVAVLIGWRYHAYLQYRETVKEELARPDTITEKFGKELATAPAPEATPPSPTDLTTPPAPQPAAAQGLGGQAGLKETTDGAFQVKKSYTEHGRQVVVKSAGDAKAYKKAGTKFAMVEPNWEAPYNLNYQGLRKVNLYLRLHDKWPQEVIQQLNGAAVTISGIVMPTGPVTQDGTMLEFWLANPIVVMAGCVFCNPPTFADLLHVETMSGFKPLTVNREQLYTDTVPVTVTGRLTFGYRKTGDGVESLFQLEMRDWRIIER